MPGEIWAVKGHLTHYPPDLQSDLFFYEHSQTNLIYCNRIRILNCLCYCPTSILTVITAKKESRKKQLQKVIISGYSICNKLNHSLMSGGSGSMSIKIPNDSLKHLQLLLSSRYGQSSKLWIIWKLKARIIRISGFR